MKNKETFSARIPATLQRAVAGIMRRRKITKTQALNEALIDWTEKNKSQAKLRRELSS